MLQIDHRESHDIDLFLDDPQYLPFLNPETQEIPLERRPDSYSSDGTRMLKLAYQDIGEIDFIVCGNITEEPTKPTAVQGYDVAMETPAEIVAKKVYYRGSSFQPRDMFDLAAVTEHFGEDYAIAALRQCGADRCRAALHVVKEARPDFVRGIVSQLMLRDGTKHLVDRAQEMSAIVLERALQ